MPTDCEAQALALLQQNATAVGFVSLDDLSRYDLYTESSDDCVIGAALVEPIDADYAEVHALAVADTHRGSGLGRRLISTIHDSVSQPTLEAKCRTGLSANEFYRQTGWTLARKTGDGQMNVWHYPD